MVNCAFFEVKLKRKIKKLRQVIKHPKARQYLNHRKQYNTQRAAMRKRNIEMEAQLDNYEGELKSRFQELGLMAQFLVEAENSAQQAQHNYNEVLSSTSWRVTAPLRWLREFLRR